MDINSATGDRNQILKIFDGIKTQRRKLQQMRSKLQNKSSQEEAAPGFLEGGYNDIPDL